MTAHLPLVIGVDPVPWARAQMAFTLGFHIILVPLGVSWAFMTLIANYRGIKKNDADAIELARRWSKYMAVTFAVGAVTGTVLSFEFGLLWPELMKRYGEGLTRRFYQQAGIPPKQRLDLIRVQLKLEQLADKK